MKDVLDKILALLETQDAKIKALEAELKEYSGLSETLTECIYRDKDAEWFDEFSDKHRSKFEPYLGMMDKLEGGDAFRAIYEKSKGFIGDEGYEEDAYVDSILAKVVEMIESLKAVVPPEAQPALEKAEEAIQEAAVANDAAENLPDEAVEAAADPPDEWSEEALEKEGLEGPQLFK